MGGVLLHLCVPEDPASIVRMPARRIVARDAATGYGARQRSRFNWKRRRLVPKPLFPEKSGEDRADFAQTLMRPFFAYAYDEHFAHHRGRATDLHRATSPPVIPQAHTTPGAPGFFPPSPDGPSWMIDRLAHPVESQIPLQRGHTCLTATSSALK